MCFQNKKRKEITVKIRGTRIIATHPSGMNANLDAGSYYRQAASGDKNCATLIGYVQ